jgi:hypothetical protein
MHCIFRSPIALPVPSASVAVLVLLLISTRISCLGKANNLFLSLLLSLIRLQSSSPPQFKTPSIQNSLNANLSIQNHRFPSKSFGFQKVLLERYPWVTNSKTLGRVFELVKLKRLILHGIQTVKLQPLRSTSAVIVVVEIQTMS